MPIFAYLCPNNGQRTQVRLPGGQSKHGYKLATSTAATCPVCQQLHFVNPATGEILSVHHKYAKLRNRDRAQITDQEIADWVCFLQTGLRGSPRGLLTAEEP